MFDKQEFKSLVVHTRKQEGEKYLSNQRMFDLLRFSSVSNIEEFKDAFSVFLKYERNLLESIFLNSRGTGHPKRINEFFTWKDAVIAVTDMYESELDRRGQ